MGTWGGAVADDAYLKGLAPVRKKAKPPEMTGFYFKTETGHPAPLCQPGSPNLAEEEGRDA
jgi:hypothetical protein